LDFRRLGLSLDDIGSSLPYREADELLDRLRAEWGTHTHAADHGLLFPMTYGEYLQLLLTRRVTAFLRGKDEEMPEIVTPWPTVPLVTDEEFKRLEAELERRSAIPK
jgi:hypothetical protein